MSGKVLDVGHKRYVLNNVIIILKRAISMINEAESAYAIGLGNNQNLITLDADLTKRLAVAEGLRTDALVQAGLIESQFPFYVKVDDLPIVYETDADVTTTAATPDTIAVNRHPDILNVFAVENWGLLIEEGDKRDHVVVDAALHTTAGSRPDLTSTLSVETVSNALTADDNVTITLEDIP